MQDTMHFTASEFRCPCCGLENMSQLTIDKLEIARDMAVVPFPINSGSRCAVHNIEIHGSPFSSHIATTMEESYGVDISCLTSRVRYRILKGLILAGFDRIGIGPTFIHADDDPTKPTNVIWTYFEE